MPEVDGWSSFSTVRTIQKITTERDGPYMTITFDLNGALYKMVGVIITFDISCTN